jgi:hypothetical protein
MSIEILRPTGKQRDVLVSSLSQFLRPEHALLSMPGLLEWQHLGDDELYNFLLAIDGRNNRTVAVKGFIPGDFWGNEGGRKEVGLVNWYASEDYIGGGIFVLRSILDDFGYLCGHGQGLSGMSQTINRQLGHILFDIEHLVLVNPELENFRIAIVPDGLHRNRAPLQIKKFGVEEVTTMLDLEKCPNYFWEDRFPHRSPEFCMNRYLRHPWHDYIFERLKGSYGAEVGIVYRIADCAESQLIKIVDIFGDERAFDFIAPYMTKVLVEKKAEFADFYVWTDNAINWTSYGFIEVSKEPGLVVPHHIAPLCQMNIHNVGMMTRSPLNSPFFTRGDTDQDRPSQ